MTVSEALQVVRHVGEDSLPWVDTGTGVDLKVMRIDRTHGTWVIRNRFQPGVQLQTHKHTGTVDGFTLTGKWHYLEYDFVSTAGSYIHEPANSVHTLTVPEDNTETTDVLFIIEGSLLNLTPDGQVEYTTDAESILDVYYAFCEQQGTDARAASFFLDMGDTDAHAGSKRPGMALAARLTDPELYTTDPHPLYRRLRNEAPIAWNDELGFWAVSRHADVVAAESDAKTYCAGGGILVEEIGTRYESPPTILHTDPPEHTRYRRLVQPGFRPSVTRDLEPVVRSRAKALVDQIPAGEPIDVVRALSVPFPLLVISEILGVPEDEWRRCYEWSEAVIPGATDWPQERRDALAGEMVLYLLNATKERRVQPRDDVLSQLATVTVDGDQLSDDELSMFLVQLLVAGNETTRNMLSAGLVALAEAPDQWRRLREDHGLLKSAVEELLRYTSPVISFMRTATRDTELGGQPIAEGEPLLLLFGSADRDEEVFGPDAGELDVGRDPNPHVAFGFGNHFCLGAGLARLEGRVALEELLGRFSSIERAGPVERSGSSVIAGVKRAELCFS